MGSFDSPLSNLKIILNLNFIKNILASIFVGTSGDDVISSLRKHPFFLRVLIISWRIMLLLNMYAISSGVSPSSSDCLFITSKSNISG